MVSPNHLETAYELEELSHQVELSATMLLRLQDFEIKLLDARGLAALLEVLLEQTLLHFELDAVELWLLDPEHRIEELLPSNVDRRCIRFVGDSYECSQFYGDALSVSYSVNGDPLFSRLFARSRRYPVSGPITVG